MVFVRHPRGSAQRVWPILSNAAQKGGLAAYTDYSLCIYTGDTFYDNSFFGLDNVFFYKTDGKAPEVNPLGEYTTKSLDENGESYFDFTGKEFINISGNGQVMGRMYDQGDDAILYDLRDGVGLPTSMYGRAPIPMALPSPQAPYTRSAAMKAGST